VRARHAVYGEREVAEVPRPLLEKYSRSLRQSRRSEKT
jgi:hypothetical protein